MPSRLTRKVRFSSAHHYSRPEWPDDRNERVFGDSRFVHGHDFELSVTIEGEIDESTGFIVDLPALDHAIESVVAPLRQRDLTEVVPEFAPGRELPSTESLARWFWTRLADQVPAPARLALVAVAEDASLGSEYWES